MSRTVTFHDRTDAARLWSGLKREIDRHGSALVPRALPAATVEDLEEKASEAGIAVTHRPDGGLAFTRLWEQDT